MKDYRVTVKIQNNYMYSAMQKEGIASASELARLADVSPNVVGEYLNLKAVPINRHGEYKGSILKISVILNTMVSDLFPAEHLNVSLKQNVASTTMNRTEVKELISDSTPDKLLESMELSENITTVLSTLTPRRREIVEKYFGITGDKMTYEDIGRTMDLSANRIRQILESALRILRHPKRTAVLRMENKSIEQLETYLK